MLPVSWGNILIDLVKTVNATGNTYIVSLAMESDHQKITKKFNDNYPDYPCDFNDSFYKMECYILLI